MTRRTRLALAGALVCVLATGCASSSLALEELEVEGTPAHSGEILSLGFVSGFAGEFLATGGQDGLVRLWALEATPVQPHELEPKWRWQVGESSLDAAPQGPITHLSGGFDLRYWSRPSHDGGLAYSCGRSCAHGSPHEIITFKTRDLSSSTGLSGPDLRALAPSLQGEWEPALLALSEEGRLSLRAPLFLLNRSPAPALTAVRSEDAALLTGYDRRALVARTTPAGESTLISVAWSRDGNPSTTQIELEAGTRPIGLATLPGHLGYLITSEGALECYDLAARRREWVRDLPGASALAASLDLLAVGFLDGSVQVFDSSGELLAEIRGERPRVVSLAFSPPRELLAIGDASGRPRLIRLERTERD